ncbi:MAG: copper homeostasis protein CutC [Bacteroidota bacterium]
MSYQIEICAGNIQSALNAQDGGADRIELCDNLWEGGTTPSIATIMFACEQLSIPVFVLIRPRGGDFVYSDQEFEIMKKDIEHAKSVGAKGIVSGILLADGHIDLDRTKELIALSKPMSFTFHRAFDLTVDYSKSLEEIIDCGADRILTSGQQMNVTEGLNTIKHLVELADGRIQILPGGGVNDQNIGSLYELGCSEFHFSAKFPVKNQIDNPKVPMNGTADIPEGHMYVSDPSKISRIKALLDSLL